MVVQQVVKVVRHKASQPHADGSVVFARWRQCAFHLVNPNRHPQRTGATFCWVALSISTAGHVPACPVLALYALKIAASCVGMWTSV